MGRYSSYGLVTSAIIPLENLKEGIRRHLWPNTMADFDLQSLRTQFPEDVYEMTKGDEVVVFKLKDCYSGSDIYSLLKDFAAITPHPRQLPPEDVEEIGSLIKNQPLSVALELADKKKFEGFQEFHMPYYLYRVPVKVGKSLVYTPAAVKGILIGFCYDKMDGEDDVQPYGFLTTLLRYRLQSNPLAPTLLAFLSV